jgi:hypothetical protein
MTEMDDVMNAPVTIGECERKHRSTRLYFVTTISILVSFIGVVIICATISWAASIKTNAVKTDLKVFEASHDKEMIHIKESLQRLEASIHDQKKMIEDLWRKNGGSH